jgi:T4-like virus Myoviridae tail sheath stabiliser
MLGSHFYHGLIRKYVILFGSLFNDIYIDRVDANGVTQRSIKVPLQYGPKERYLTRYQQNPDLLREVSMVFPRMSFEITRVSYDPDRKLNSIGKVPTVSTNKSTLSTQYNPVAYNFDITLSIISRNTEDAVRIVEQIMPFFTPQWTETLNLIPDMNISVDIPIVIKNVTTVDTYASNFEDKEWVLWEMTFTLKGYLYGPIRRQSVIKEVIVNDYIPANTISEGVGNTDPSQTFNVTPGLTANGEPTSNAAQSIPASQISASDNYGFIIDFNENLS